MMLSILVYGCQDGEFRCDNDLCLVKEVQNSDCEGIDWCVDNSGCGINVGLIAGLCGTLGALVLLAIIVLCIVWCCTKVRWLVDLFLVLHHTQPLHKHAHVVHRFFLSCKN